MLTSPLNKLIQHLVADCRADGCGMTDGELLARFLRGRDDGALAALVRRHAPMVWGVCCRLLHNHHDAEDAFQATFLVLVRKASTLRSPGMVGNWLYGAAYRTALEAKKAAAKRRAKEAKSPEFRLRAWLVRSAIQTSEPRFKLRHPEGAIQSLAFSSGGQTLATGGAEGVVRLWNVADGKEARLLRQFPPAPPRVPRSEY